MPGKRSTVRQIRELLRLHHEVHLGERQIAAICQVGRGTVQRFLQRATAAGLPWPLPEDLDDTQLEKLLFPPVLWEEYQEDHPDGIRYSWFCDQYSAPAPPTLDHFHRNRWTNSPEYALARHDGHPTAAGCKRHAQ